MNSDLNPDIDHSNSIIHLKHNNLIRCNHTMTTSSSGCNAVSNKTNAWKVYVDEDPEVKKSDIIIPSLDRLDSFNNEGNMGYITLPPPPDADGCASRSLPKSWIVFMNEDTEVKDSDIIIPSTDKSDSFNNQGNMGNIALPPPPNANGCENRSLPEYVSNGQGCSCMHECLCPWYGSDQSEEEEREPDMDAVSRFVDALTGNWVWGEFKEGWD